MERGKEKPEVARETWSHHSAHVFWVNSKSLVGLRALLLHGELDEEQEWEMGTRNWAVHVDLCNVTPGDLFGNVCVLWMKRSDCPQWPVRPLLDVCFLRFPGWTQLSQYELDREAIHLKRSHFIMDASKIIFLEFYI